MLSLNRGLKSASSNGAVLDISSWNFGGGGANVAVKFAAEGRISRGQKFYPNGSHGGIAPFSSICIEEMRNSSSRNVRLAHDNSLAKGGLNFR